MGDKDDIEKILDKIIYILLWVIAIYTPLSILMTIIFNTAGQYAYPIFGLFVYSTVPFTKFLLIPKLEKKFKNKEA